jgi:N-acetylmuramoyl-L-alanine amidase
VAIKLFISQANQSHNAGPGGYTEKAGMDAISRTLAKVFAADDRFVVRSNSAGSRVDTAAENADEANRWGADYYVALHSNAGMRGSVTFYHSGSPRGKRLAVAIQAAVAPLSPGKETAGRVRTMDGFIEIHRPHAPAVLVELEAHDWKVGVRWLTGQRKAIALALYRGICRGVGLAPLGEPAEPPALTGKTVPVPVPVKRPRWWGAMMRFVKRTRKGSR